MESAQPAKRFAVVIAAGGVAPEPIQRRENVVAKGEIVVGGRPCVAWVAQAVVEARLEGVVVGNERLAPMVAPLPWVPERQGAIQNFRAGVEAVSAEYLVFLPADAPFLTGDALRGFVNALRDRPGDWLAVGLTEAEAYRVAFPGCPKASVKVREGRFHTGALYAGTRAAFLQTLDVLEGLFRDRRSQFAMATRIGVWQALRFGLGTLTIPEAEAAFLRVLGVQGLAIQDCDPAMVPDIDNLEELDQIRACWNQQDGSRVRDRR